MKRIKNWRQYLLYSLLPLFPCFLLAQPVKVFSRYNYFLPTNKISVIAALPDSISSNTYQLSVLYNGKQLAETTTISNHFLAAIIPTGDLPMDTSVVHYKLENGDLFTTEGDIHITRLPAKSNAVQIDELTGGLIVDGFPFFPFGFYCGHVGDISEKEVIHGFNMIGPYQSNLPNGLAERKAYMDRCAQLGMHVQYGVNSLIGSGHNGAKGLGMSEEDKLALLKNEIIAFRDHPALLSWYINDEPDGQGRPPALLEKAYKLIHSLDPYHPISIVFMMPSKAAEFKNTMDIAMTDPYPIPGPADQVINYVSSYHKAYEYEKPVWLVPQAFGGQEMWQREPTAQEIRLMTYMGLIEGAKGIQYFIRGDGNTNPQSVSAWSSCSDLAVETAQMSGFLLSADAAPAVHSDDKKILAKAYSYKGDVLIVVANNENRPKPLQITVASADTDLKSNAELWFENRSVPYNEGHISDIIDAYGTRVYLLRKKGADDYSLLSSNNIVVNPGFEKIVSPGLPIGSNRTYTSADKKDFGATAFTDPAQSKEGMFSLRLITPVDSGGNKIRFLPLVINKGNSYIVSVWAKAKQSGRMPSFRLMIDGMNESHVYELNNEWKKYSFAFTAAGSSTSAILSLELLTQGTAWFDVMQVSPTPVINYKINFKNYTADVTIKSDINDAQIRYAIGRQPDAKSKLYDRPFTLNEASTVYAGVFQNNKLVAVSKMFVPVNLALGKPVNLAIPFSQQYKANGDSTLTDGVMGTTAFKDGKWLGFSGTDLDATVDLQKLTKVKEVTASFLCDPNSGIFLPSKVSVFISVDGKHFTPAGEKVNTEGNKRGEPYLSKVSIFIKQKPVRYIRIVAKAFGEIPDGYLFKGSTSWLFTDEILVQ